MDFYELTMSQCYFNRDKEEEVVFDMFYRRNPNGGGYCICAGLEEVIGYIQNLHFEEEDIDLSSLAEQILGGVSGLSSPFYTLPATCMRSRKAPRCSRMSRSSVSRRRSIDAQLLETALLLCDEPPDAHRHQGPSHRPGS